MEFYRAPSVNFSEDEDLLKTTRQEILFWSQKLGVSPLHLFQLSDNELRDKFTTIQYIQRCKQQKQDTISKLNDLKTKLLDECRLTGGNEGAVEKMIAVILKNAAKQIAEVFNYFEVKKQKNNNWGSSCTKPNDYSNKHESPQPMEHSYDLLVSKVNPFVSSTQTADHIHDYSKVLEPKTKKHSICYFSYPNNDFQTVPVETNRENYSHDSTIYDCLCYPMKESQETRISDTFDCYCSECNNFNYPKTTSILFKRPVGGQSDRNDSYQQNGNYYQQNSSSAFNQNSYYNSAPIPQQHITYVQSTPEEDQYYNYQRNVPYPNISNGNYRSERIDFIPNNESRGPSLRYEESLQPVRYNVQDNPTYIDNIRDYSEDSVQGNEFQRNALPSETSSLNSTISDFSINNNTSGVLERFLELKSDTPVGAGEIVFNADAYYKLHGRAAQFLLEPLKETEVGEPFIEPHPLLAKQTNQASTQYNAKGVTPSQYVSPPIQNSVNRSTQPNYPLPAADLRLDMPSTSSASNSISNENPLNMTVKEFFHRYLPE